MGERGPAAAPARGHRWRGRIVWWLRAFLVLFLVDLMVQVGLAALFVTGDVELLEWHNANANVILSTILFFAFVLAVLLWRPARGSSGPAWWIVGLFLLIEAQKTLGYLRLVGVHIMLGVTIFGLAAGLVVWAMMYQPEAGK